MRFLLLSFIVLLGACDSGEPGEANPLAGPLGPTEVVEQWLEAVAAVDLEALEGPLVEPVGLALLAGVENQVRSAELVGLIDAGVTGQLADGYWRSFRDEFGSFRGSDIGSITVGAESPIPSNPDYMAVEISTSEQSAFVVVRTNDPDKWQVDMVATLGTGLVGQLREYLESALEGDYSVPIADAYRSAIVPGLDAALALDPEDARLVFETEFIRQLVGS